MADEQPPKGEEDMSDPHTPGNVIALRPALVRKRVLELMDAALKQRAPVSTVDATDQMIELDINTTQIIHGIKHARIIEFSEDVSNGRALFTARLLSAGEEFFVSAAVERLVPFAGSHVVIKRVWR